MKSVLVCRYFCVYVEGFFEWTLSAVRSHTIFCCCCCFTKRDSPDIHAAKGMSCHSMVCHAMPMVDVCLINQREANFRSVPLCAHKPFNSFDRCNVIFVTQCKSTSGPQSIVFVIINLMRMRVSVCMCECVHKTKCIFLCVCLINYASVWWTSTPKGVWML